MRYITLAQSRIVPPVLAAFFFAAAFFCPARAEEWRRFDSSEHFTVKYPGNWYRDVDSDVRGPLNLMDSKDGYQKGVMVASGHAGIHVTKLSEFLGGTLGSKIDEDVKFADSVLERKKVPVKAVPNGCSALTKVVWKFTLGDPDFIRQNHLPVQDYTAYYCEAPGHGIVAVYVLYWENDRRQSEYQKIGFRMARSILWSR